MARSPRTFTPKKAGEEIGASADTIRRYCQLYRRHLSEGATPSPGKARVLTAIDVYLLKLAKQATEAGSTVEEVDTLLASVALPEDLVAGEEAVAGEGETLPATIGETVSDSALALLRQLATTLDRLEARDRRFDQLAQEIADLRRVIESPPATSSPAPTVETPQPSPATFWSAYAPYVVAVVAVVLAILVIALVVALLR
jgi:DNA-binding transcriptional MerR regulator